MARLFFVGAAALLALGGCASGTGGGGGTPSPMVATANPLAVHGLALADPIRSGNVTLIPVVSERQTEVQDDMLTLAEAQKLGVVAVEELPEGAEVPFLRVTNSGKKPILLIAGDLLIGGKQDRIVAKDTVVPPGKTIKVPVYCVEQGRWEGPTKSFRPEAQTVPSSVREVALYSGQSEVWDRVGDFNRTAGSPAMKGSTIMDGLETEKVRQRVETSLPDLQKRLEGMGNVVGVAFLLNGKLQTVELFGSPKMFQAAKTGLLRGFLSEAAQAGEEAGSPASANDVALFLRKALEAGRTASGSDGAGHNASLADSSVRGAEITLSPPKDGESGLRGLIHGTYSMPAKEQPRGEPSPSNLQVRPPGSSEGRNQGRDAGFGGQEGPNGTRQPPRNVLPKDGHERDR